MSTEEVELMISNVKEQMYEDARMGHHHPEYLLGAMSAINLIWSLLEEKLSNVFE